MHAILNTPCYGTGQVQNHTMSSKFHQSRRNIYKTKQQIKQLHVIMYSFPDSLYTPFSSGRRWRFHMCCSVLICVLFHMLSWWRHQNIKLNGTCSTLLKNCLYQAYCNTTTMLATCLGYSARCSKLMQDMVITGCLFKTINPSLLLAGLFAFSLYFVRSSIIFFTYIISAASRSDFQLYWSAWILLYERQ